MWLHSRILCSTFHNDDTKEIDDINNFVNDYIAKQEFINIVSTLKPTTNNL